MKLSKDFNLLNFIFKSLIVFYQATISHFLGGNCRYYPSCSHYAKQAFETHSFLTAFKLSANRILSCHPFSKKNYYDPVPAQQSTSEVSFPRTV